MTDAWLCYKIIIRNKKTGETEWKLAFGMKREYAVEKVRDMYDMRKHEIVSCELDPTYGQKEMGR